MNQNALQVLTQRYLLKDEHGRPRETPAQMFRRIADAVATAEDNYCSPHVAAQVADDFYAELATLRFLPNSPTLMNAGTELGQLSACFVLPLEDSMEGIFETLKNMAIIHQSGGGTGFSFSRLRPSGDIVRTTDGAASGPVSFMRVFDAATDIVKQGGRRRGANMGILKVDHPDILDFVTCKETEEQLSNFNISVAVTDEFMAKAAAGEDYQLISPCTRKPTGALNAKSVLDLIVATAWRTGDPGLVFIDRVNEANPTPYLGEIESTNPCGEQPLLPYESCNLASLILGRFVATDDFDWPRLEKSTRLAVRFLDDVIDTTKFPLPQVAALTRANRKVGLGVMGFADALVMLGIPYDSEHALALAEKVMKFVSETSVSASERLAAERGSFPNFQASSWTARGFKMMRNATLTTVAPTGTISLIAGASSGIEPLFAISFTRHVLDGNKLLEVNPLFETAARAAGIYDDALLGAVLRTGTLADVEAVPDSLKRVFVTALDIAPEWHVRMQAAFQRYVDNGVSKTVNLPAGASIDEVRKVFLLAYDLRCKGITVYRYGSKKEQVLNVREDESVNNQVDVGAEYAGGCPAGECPF